MRIAYFDCFSGISGDMTIAALLDAGLSLKILSKELARLKVRGYSLKAARVRRAGISGTKFDCLVGHKTHTHRSVREIMRIIDRSALNKTVKTMAKEIFSKIGESERRVHGIGTKEGTYLHELGDVDSIVDIVGASIALYELGIEEIHASPITMGRTMIDCAHGRLPIPGPATLELLKGAPVKFSDIEAELVTPTGAGILSAVCKGFGPMPAMKISRTGYGAGTKDFGRTPNMLRVIIGETGESFNSDRVAVIEANIDDMNPQFFEYVTGLLFDGGALDVYITPIQMKKSRPAFKLTVLANRCDLECLSSLIFRETSTIGVRFHEESRYKLERKIIEVNTKYGKVNVKSCCGADGIKTISPEYDDCAKLARAKKVPLRIIYDEAKKNVKI